MKKVLLEVRNSFVRVITNEKFVHEIISNSLSYEDKNAKWQKKAIERKTGRDTGISTTRTAYDTRRLQFYTGSIYTVLAHLKAHNVPFEISDKRENPKKLSPEEMKEKVVLKDLTLYDFQQEAVECFLQKGRGVLKLATGGGKTEVAAALIKKLNLPTLFLTHRINLMNQTAARIAKRIPEMADEIGLIGDGNWDCDKKIVFASVQTLISRIEKDPEALGDYFKRFKFLIIDEAHRSKAEYFRIPALLCSQAFYRLGLTATPFMQEDPEADLALMGAIGDVIYEVKNNLLIERGLLAQPYFKFIEVNGPKMDKISDFKEIYKFGIVKNEERNEKILKVTEGLVKNKKKVLVVVYATEHGEHIVKRLEEMGINSEFCSGKMSTVKREKALRDIRDGRLDCIVASNIFDEGIDVPALDAVVLAGGNKSAISLFQRIGRVIRRKETNNYAIVVDFFDKQHYILKNHSSIRQSWVTNEKGFKILD